MITEVLLWESVLFWRTLFPQIFAFKLLTLVSWWTSEPQNKAPWYTEFLKLKEFEKTAEEGYSDLALIPLPWDRP